jgi:hypothetical protein
LGTPSRGQERERHAFEIYFKDPFLAYIHLAFVPFFVGLYHAFKILGYARRNEIFFQRSVRALRIIKYCALTTAIFILGAEAYLFTSAIIATAAAVFGRILQNSVGIRRGLLRSSE